MLDLNTQTLEYTSHHPDQTRQLGLHLGSALQPGDLICLQGDLGAGKTTFVQGLAQGWGSVDAVSSPTFILVNMYRHATGDALFHMDAYRLDSAPEAEELDLDTMLADGALLVEWPERLPGLIPAERLWIELEHRGETERHLKFTATGARYLNLLSLIRQSVGAE